MKFGLIKTKQIAFLLGLNDHMHQSGYTFKSKNFDTFFFYLIMDINTHVLFLIVENETAYLLVL